jgi:hypothetical protein
MGDRVRRVTEMARRSPVMMWAIVLIAVQTAIRVWQAVPGNYWQDDYHFLRLARDQGFTNQFLLQTYNDHLQPAGFALTWVCAQFPGTYLPAALIIVATQLVTSIAMLLLLREVVGPRPSLLIGLAVFLFTPLTVPTVTWWASFIITLPVQLVLAVCGYSHLRFLRHGHAGWLCLSAGALALGFAFTEKTVVVPVFVFLLTIVTARGSWRQVVLRLLRLWPVWLGYATLTVAYIAFYLGRVNPAAHRARSVGEFLGFAEHQIWDVFVIGLMGGPWHDQGVYNLTWQFNSLAVRLIVLQGVIALGILGWQRRGKSSLVLWGALAFYVVMNVSITAAGRGRWAGIILGDSRYITDALPLAAVVISLLLTPTREASRQPDITLRRAAVPVTALTVLALFNSSMVTLSHVSSAFHRTEVSTYVDNARAALAADPDLDIYNSEVPSSILIPAFRNVLGPGSNSAKIVLDAYDVHPRYELPSSEMRILDDQGRAQPIQLVYGASGVIHGVQDCGIPLSEVQNALIPLNFYVPADKRVMKVTYYTSGHGTLRIAYPGHRYDVGLDVGNRAVYLVVEGAMSHVSVALIEGEGTVCVNGLSVGYPIPDTSSVQ